MSHLLLTLSLLVGANPDADIDRHALLAPPEVEQSVERLAKYLIQPAKGDRDKARVLFRWMTDRIGFDVDALITDHPGELRPAAILRERKARSLGHAVLFEELARQAGLEAAIIPGFAKGMAAPEEGRPLRPNHAWNAVKIEGQWQLVDTTLGAGNLRGQRYRRAFQEQYFLPPPQHLLYTHYPVDPRWQLVPWPIGPQQWDTLPLVDLRVLNMGVSFANPSRHPQPGQGIVNLRGTNSPAKVLTAPQGKTLAPGQDYYFLIDAPEAQRIAFVQGDRWVFLNKNGTRFEGTIRPEPGQLRINIQPRSEGRLTYTMFGYQVDAR